MDELFIVWSMLGAARRIGLGPVSFGSMVVDTGRRLDLAVERALGMGALSLRSMVIPFRIRLGVDTGNRFYRQRIWLSRLPLASRPGFLFQ